MCLGGCCVDAQLLDLKPNSLKWRILLTPGKQDEVIELFEVFDWCKIPSITSYKNLFCFKMFIQQMVKIWGGWMLMRWSIYWMFYLYDNLCGAVSILGVAIVMKDFLQFICCVTWLLYSLLPYVGVWSATVYTVERFGPTIKGHHTLLLGVLQQISYGSQDILISRTFTCLKSPTWFN